MKLYPAANANPNTDGGYNYVDEQGKLLYQVLRGVDAQGKKTFRQRRPDESKESGWDWKLGDCRRVAYRLNELDNARPLYIVEGESAGGSGAGVRRSACAWRSQIGSSR